MSDNKLDFRKVKQTQFDPGQVMKGSFSELQSGLRTFSTTPILKDAYTHFIQELDSNLRPTKVEYYQAIDPARDRLTFRSDNAGDLAGKYFSLQEPITKKVHVFWYRVSSAGTAPGIGDIEHVIDINTNDFASVVSFATRTVIKTVPEFNIIGNNLVASYIDIEYYQFGEAEAVDLGNSGFLISRLKQGDSEKVGIVELSYDINGNPIYNGSTLFGLIFNPYTTIFERSISLSLGNISVGVDIDYSTDSISVKNSTTGQELVKSDGSIDSNSLNIGTEDGTNTGTKRVFVNNIRQQILASHDREQELIYQDFGTKNQRITEILYTSNTFPGVTVKKVLTYSLISGKYRRDSIKWEIL